MQKRERVLCLILGLVLTACGVSEKKSNKKIGDGEKLPKEAVEKLTAIEVRSLIKNGDNQQNEDMILNWHHYDLEENGLFGVSSDAVYKNLKLTQKREIIVAVIDSGVDVQHEDLKEVIWINKKEIAGNGIDDDGNGYIDDINGWNFIGGADGKNIDEETLEVTRIYKSLLSRLQNGEVLNDSEDNLFEKVKKEVEENLQKYSKMFKAATDSSKTVKASLETLGQRIGIDEIKTRKDLEDINTTESDLIKIKEELLIIWDLYRGGFKGIDRVIDFSGYYANTGYNMDYNARSEIVGDDPNDFSDIHYGNNDVKGPDSSHGTHVAGSIAAKRDNGIGIDGIASNVKIMVLRAVPNGDERDKDIALAVRYAADNGAHIINMSFGKGYSSNKTEVDAAFEYAAARGVLMVHAAGNSSVNVDGGKNNFPNSYKLGSGVLKVDSLPNWIEVGASTKDLGLELVASFSNFGNEAVTVFSPGHRIFSTTPENNYAAFSGTSMACPVTAGVAALLMSEFPTMTAQEAKIIITATVNKQTELEVRKPSETRKDPDFRLPVPFKNLSQNDGVVNIMNAMKLAKRLANQDK